MSPLRFNHSVNFNPLPRKEGDSGWDYYANCTGLISIHSLVKRETTIVVIPFAMLRISIHSLVKRETGRVIWGMFTEHHFNPLPRKEGDHHTLWQPLQFPISIHSLVKRETSNHSKVILMDTISIHSLVKRETRNWGERRTWKARFQSTPS